MGEGVHKKLVPLPGHEEHFRKAVENRNRVVRMIARKERELADLVAERKRIERDHIQPHSTLVPETSEWKTIEHDS